MAYNHLIDQRSLAERATIITSILLNRESRRCHSQRGWYDDDGVRQGGLIAFVRDFWHVLEPETPFVDGWSLWAICEHLEAVTFGEITRLLINVPPGFAKSLLTDVFWPAWEWGPMGKAHLRYVAFSYSASLTERDNGRFRDLITCREYQDLYPAVRLRNKTTIKVMSTATGWKLASSVGGVGTGERGDRIILDDPHNVKESESETIRTETVRWFREAMSNRLNHIEAGAIVIIMQRVHESDVSGVILSEELDYCHLCIPMEYDWAFLTTDDGDPVKTEIGWTDPRYDARGPEYCDGIEAWPDRFPPHSLAKTKKEVGPYAWSGQYLQSPAPRGGGLFRTEWWQLWDAPDGKFPELDYIIASLDGAFTDKEENDPSALTIWGVFTQRPEVVGDKAWGLGQAVGRRIILLNAWRKFLKFSGPRRDQLPGESSAAYKHRCRPEWGLVEWVADSCRRFKVDLLLIEGKASGISAAQELSNRFGGEGWGIRVMPVRGDKVARALAAQPTFSQLMVYAPNRDWAQLVIDEMSKFPKDKHDDLTDSTTQAINYLRSVGLAQTDGEASAEEVERVTHRSPLKALYPV